jgi:chromosomal replication initiator protein
MTDVMEDRWGQCKAWIGSRLGPEDATTWLSSLRLDEVRSHRIVLSGIPNSFFKYRISTRFRPLILESLRQSFPDIPFASEPSLELQVGREAAAGPAALPGGSADPGQGATEPPAGAEGEVEQRYRFQTFITAPANASALHFAREVAEGPGRRYNPLLLVGETGLGKTHLMLALRHALAGGGEGRAVAYRTGEAFRNEVLEAITRRRMQALRDEFRSLDALLVDEVGFLLVSPKAQEELLHTFDALHRAGRQLVFSAQRFPAALSGLDPSLRSRLEMGLIAELTPPDAAARRRVVESRAQAEGIVLPSEVAALLAERITRNLRQLEGALVRLGAYASLHGQPITLEFAERFAQPFFDAPPGGDGLPLPREAILERVADRFGVTVRSLKGRDRSPNLVNARRVAIHLLKRLGDCSYSEIGTLLGNRSHSTIVHGHQTLMAALRADERLTRAVLQMTQELAD